MKIGLIDVDSHNFPNLALMKISAHHKSKGDTVDWWNGFEHYDIVYKAKVFDEIYTKDNNTVIDADNVIQGGTGYNLTSILPKEIEHQYPDYELYGDKYSGIAYGFLTRGCPRGCEFCIVGEKEGLKSYQVAELNEFWRGQKQITLFDPNLLASSDSVKLLNNLIQSKMSIDINQGFDIRFMTDEKAHLINQMKLKILHFAWDNYEFKTYEKLKYYRPKLKFDGRKLRVYVLANFNTTIEQDLERIYKLRELDYDPYVMIYDKPKANKQIKQIQRWVNNKFIWRTCDKFENYKS